MNTTQTVSASGLHNIATETSGWDMRTCMSTRQCDDTTDFIIMQAWKYVHGCMIQLTYMCMECSSLSECVDRCEASCPPC